MSTTDSSSAPPACAAPAHAPARPSSAQPLPPSARAQEIIALIRAVAALLPAEAVALDDALARVLQETVCAPEDQPAFDHSAFDGYALRLDDPGPDFRIVEKIRAGDWKPRELALGEAVQIATGAALPCDGLRVVPKEDVRAEPPGIHVLRMPAGRNVRLRGEAARRGEELVRAGTPLGAGALALLASIGHTQPRVCRLPRVAHLVTGNELVAPDQLPGPGQIRDSNSVLVRGFLDAWRTELFGAALPEDAAHMRTTAINPPAPIRQADLLLVSGGASVGEHDFTRRFLEDLGFTILVAKANLRPGKPLVLGVRGSSLAFGLPGNPLSHFVCLNLFVRAALDCMSGRTLASPFQPGILAQTWQDDPSPRETFWPARLGHSARGAEISPLPWTNSGDLTPLARANALAQIPPDSGALPAGAPISYVSTEP
jgi:molybdopterin molybdotransferase